MLIPIGMAECLESGGLRRQFMANSRMNKERAVNGIVMIALEDPAYAAAAFNLALSIKHFNPFLDITLLTDSTHQRCYRNEHYSVFDRIAEISSEDYTNDGRFCPGKAKLALYKYSAYKYSLYLDADSICFKNLDALFKQLNGHAFKSQRLRNYTQWTDAETFKSFFEVDPGQTINSSWIYFENDSVFRQAEKYYARGFPPGKLDQKWGSSLPDELFFNAALEKLTVDSECDVPVMYFDFSEDVRTIEELMAQYYFVTFCGNASSTRLMLREWYDKYVAELCAQRRIECRFNLGEIIARKHIDMAPSGGQRRRGGLSP
jgi:hypothetical protein